MAVGLSIATQGSIDALTVPAAELVRLAHQIAIGLVGAIETLGITIADGILGHTVAIAASELIGSAA